MSIDVVAILIGSVISVVLPLGGTGRKEATNAGGPILVGPWSVLVLDALLSSVPG